MTNQLNQTMDVNLNPENKFSEKTIVSALTYVFGWVSGILVLNLPQYNKERDHRFHAWQSILMSIAFFVGHFLIGVLPMMGMGSESSSELSGYVLPSLMGSFLFAGISMVLSVGALALWIVTIVRVLHEEPFEIPVISDCARKLADKKTSVLK